MAKVCTFHERAITQSSSSWRSDDSCQVLSNSRRWSNAQKYPTSWYISLPRRVRLALQQRTCVSDLLLSTRVNHNAALSSAQIYYAVLDCLLRKVDFFNCLPACTLVAARIKQSVLDHLSLPEVLSLLHTSRSLYTQVTKIIDEKAVKSDTSH